MTGSETLHNSKPARITLLLLGSDQRNGIAGPINTDMMLVLSIDVAQHTALMLSLPRDIYTKIAGTFEQGRINTAYAIGQRQSRGGGGRLVTQTVQQLLGISIDYYLLIDFAVFFAVIDAIGPITICPTQPIFDDRFPSHAANYTTVSFPKGCQELDAIKLLQYARVRHNAGYDFGRMQRQQEIIRGIRSRILSPRGIYELVRHLAALWGTMKAKADTNMQLEQMLHLASIAIQIPRQNIYSAALTVQHGHLREVTTLANEQVLIPAPDALHDRVAFLFSANPSNASVSQLDPRSESSYIGRTNAQAMSWLFRMVILGIRIVRYLPGLAMFHTILRRLQYRALPQGFTLSSEDTGVRLFQHDKQGSFIVAANLQHGALVDLITGDMVDAGTHPTNQSASSPVFQLQTVEERWQKMSEAGLNLFAITNGQMHSPDGLRSASLALPLKTNGNVISMGESDSVIPGKKLMLQIWPHKAEIVSFLPQRFLDSTAPDILVGLALQSRKGNDGIIARTCLGVADPNRDGYCEVILILTSPGTTQEAAAKLLRAFGAKHMMILDSSASTQLICEGKSRIKSARPVPQMLAVSGGKIVSPSHGPVSGQ